ncbi:MAG: protein TolR [Halothiobacillaceae bacterium]
MNEINVVPYIDVMLVLLIIFMITAPMLEQGVEVELPRTVAAALEAGDIEPVVISVSRDGAYYVNVSEDPETAVPLSQVTVLVQAARAVNPEVPVLVKGDGEAAYAHVVRAMSRVQQAGIERVGLVTESGGEP